MTSWLYKRAYAGEPAGNRNTAIDQTKFSAQSGSFCMPAKCRDDFTRVLRGTKAFLQRKFLCRRSDIFMARKIVERRVATEDRLRLRLRAWLYGGRESGTKEVLRLSR